MTTSVSPARGEPIDWEQEGEHLAFRALAAGDPTGWFEQLYAAGATGRVQLPWSGLDAHPLLVDWAHSHSIAGAGRRAVVVGCGLGADAEYLARLGFDITGFDISATAVRLAGQRFPQTTVHHRMANVLELPTTCRHAFVLLVEIITVQALPDPPRRQAIANIARLVAAGRMLLVIAAAVHDPEAPASPLPPWPLRRDEIDGFATDGLSPVRVELLPAPGQPGQKRWRAEFHRPQGHADSSEVQQ